MERGENIGFIHLYKSIYTNPKGCFICVYRKRQRQMIKTGVLKLLERPGWMLAERTHARHGKKNTALRHKRRQIACYCLNQLKPVSLQPLY